MKFSTAVALFLAAAAPGLAAPLEPRARTLYPVATSQYNVWTGAVNFKTKTGLIQKTGGKSADITTLVTFDIPEDVGGKQCELIFELDSTATATGSRRAQVFSSQKPATEDTSSWPNGNLRDQHV